MNNIAPNKPLYLYQQPMFSLTVSTVVIVDTGVMTIEENGIHRFPGGVIKAGLETVQFAAVRYVKEQLGIRLKKESLIPVDFRSDPSRSEEGNMVDIGFVCAYDLEEHKIPKLNNATWKSVNFETRKTEDSIKFYMDHEILLDRALELIVLMK